MEASCPKRIDQLQHLCSSPMAPNTYNLENCICPNAPGHTRSFRLFTAGTGGRVTILRLCMGWRKTSPDEGTRRGISSTGAWETREARGPALFSMWREPLIICACLLQAISLTCNESCQLGIPPVDTWLSGWRRARAWIRQPVGRLERCYTRGRADHAATPGWRD